MRGGTAGRGAPRTPLRILARAMVRITLPAGLVLGLGGCIGAVIGAAAIGAAAGAASSAPRSPAATSATAALPVGTAVQLQFLPPRDVELRYDPDVAGAAADSGQQPGEATTAAPVDSAVRIGGALLVVGRVRRASADTTWIAVSEVRSRARRTGYPLHAEPVLVVTGDDVVRIERLGSRPISAALLAALGATAGILLLLVLCDATSCFD